MSQPLPLRPWRKIVLSFAGGFVLMNGVLAAVTPAEPSLPEPQAIEAGARAKALAGEVLRIYETLDSVLLRRLDAPSFPMRPDMAAALENEVLSLSDRALTAPERVRRLLAQEGEDAGRTDRIMADLQPIFDRRLDYLLSVADALHIARAGVSADKAALAAVIAELRLKQANLAADAPILADLERRLRE